MQTCKCCGQEINGQESAVIAVDEDLLALIDGAYEDAERDGSTFVEIAHLARRLAVAGTTPFAAFDSEARALADGAAWWLSYFAGIRTSGAARTAPDLAILMQRAEARARHQGRTSATVDDALTTLLSDASDLASAEFIERTQRPFAGRTESTTRIVNEAPIAGNRFEGGASDYDYESLRFHETNADLAQSDGAQSIRALEHRLERHDRMLQAIQTQLSLLIDATAREAEARTIAANQRERARADRASEIDGTERISRRPSSSMSSSASSFAAVSEWRRLKRRRWQSLRRRRRQSRTSVPVSMPVSIPVDDRVTERSVGPKRPELSIVRDRPLEPGREGEWNRADHVATRQHIDAHDEREPENERTKRFYLAPDDDIVDAPSIGNRTSEYLHRAGVYKVRDLLEGDAGQIARKADVRYITAQRVEEWKAQARLVCIIPWLRGTHAQLLVGAGYPTVDRIVGASAEDVSSAILKFAATRDGQSVLRSGPPPSGDRIAKWVEHAALAEPARAA